MTAAAFKPLIGAIRWDAWATDKLTQVVIKSLSPPEHRFRLPWFATVDAQDRVHIEGGRPGIMDQEIRYAADAGIDYWAFCQYADHEEPSLSLRQYLASPLRDRIQFCMILHACMGSRMPDDLWPQERDRQVRLLQEPTHVRVLGDRPLVFLYATDTADTILASRIADFRAAARAADIANPYIAFMGWEPLYDWNRASKLGFDCVSAYGFGYMTHTETLGAPFAGYAEKTEREQWGVFAANKVPSIPLIHTGWDPRPRNDNPVPWGNEEAAGKDQRYIEPATPEEIAVHTAHCVEWIRQHPDINPTHAAIYYSWNENDEGGWLVPTRKPDGTPDTGRVDAVRRVLRPN